MANSGQRVEVHAAFHFTVEIDGIDGAVFNECTLPPLEVETVEQKEGGYNTGVHLLPGRVKAGRITLKSGVVKSSKLLNWYQDTVNGKLEPASVTIKMVDPKDGQDVLSFRFASAYPVKWSGPSFKTSESTVAIETLELAFSEFSFE
jgi:phage tail-like protein